MRKNWNSIVYAFAEECPEPTADQIVAWKEKHPKYADEIVEMASILLLIALDKKEGFIREPTRAELSEAARRSKQTFLEIQRHSQRVRHPQRYPDRSH
jgi:hypothetical protein